MRFSLKRFFEELQLLLDANIKPETKQKAIQLLLTQAKNYAKECNAL